MRIDATILCKVVKYFYSYMIDHSSVNIRHTHVTLSKSKEQSRLKIQGVPEKVRQ